jgi:hypothetical protein
MGGCRSSCGACSGDSFGFIMLIPRGGIFAIIPDRENQTTAFRG